MSCQLINIATLQDGTIEFSVPDATRQFLSQIQHDITPIAAVGPYRSGKSWMLGYLSKQANAFNTSNGSQACTRGIHINTKPLLTKNLLFMDTEGLGAPGSNVEIDSKILACAILFAAKVYFFVVGKIDTKLLDSLQCAIGTAKWLKDASNQHCFDAQKPQLVVVIKDLSLQLQDKSGKAISADEYFNNCLDEYCTTNDSELKTAIGSLFSSVACMTTPIPCAEHDMKDMTNLFPKFQTATAAIARDAYNMTQTKLIAENTNMNGPILLQMAEQLCKALSQPGAPRLLNVWQAAMEQAAIEKRHKMLQHVRTKLQNTSLTKFSLNILHAKELFQLMITVFGSFPQTWKHADLVQLLQSMNSEVEEWEKTQQTRFHVNDNDVAKWASDFLPATISAKFVPLLQKSSELQHENEDLKKELQEKIESFNALEDQIATLTTDTVLPESALADLQQKLDESQRNCEQAQSHADEIMLMHTTFQTEIKDQIAKGTERNQQLAAELTAATQNLDANMRQVEQLNAQLLAQAATIKQLTNAQTDNARKRKLDEVQTKQFEVKLERAVKHAADMEQRYKETQDRLRLSNDECQKARIDLMRAQCTSLFK